jgi:hypothetical protein
LRYLLLVIAVAVIVIIAGAGLVAVIRVGVVAIAVALDACERTSIALHLAADGQGPAVLLAVLFEL